MSDKAKILAGLQIIVTDLAQQADGHELQSRVFAAQGFSKLADKYAEHAKEERAYVTKCADRIIDLGGKLKLEAKKEAKLFDDAIENRQRKLVLFAAVINFAQKIAGKHNASRFYYLFSKDCLLCNVRLKSF